MRHRQCFPPVLARAESALPKAVRLAQVDQLAIKRAGRVVEAVVTIDRQLQRIANKNTFTTPKGEKVRTIRIPSAVALEVRRHLREYADDGLLFRRARTGDGMRRDQFYACAWHLALASAGLAADRFKFHSLRHFAGSAMLAEGVNPMAVAGHLGDTLETLQRVYAHWLRDDRDVPAEALDRILIDADQNLADSSRTADGSSA